MAGERGVESAACAQRAILENGSDVGKIQTSIFSHRLVKRSLVSRKNLLRAIRVKLLSPPGFFFSARHSGGNGCRLRVGVVADLQPVNIVNLVRLLRVRGGTVFFHSCPALAIIVISCLSEKKEERRIFQLPTARNERKEEKSEKCCSLREAEAFQK